MLIFPTFFCSFQFLVQPLLTNIVAETCLFNVNKSAGKLIHIFIVGLKKPRRLGLWRWVKSQIYATKERKKNQVQILQIPPCCFCKHSFPHCVCMIDNHPNPVRYTKPEAASNALWRAFWATVVPLSQKLLSLLLSQGLSVSREENSPLHTLSVSCLKLLDFHLKLTLWEVS